MEADLAIDSHVEQIGHIRQWLYQHARAEGFAEETVRKLGLAVSEACANIIKHAYKGRPDCLIKAHLSIDSKKLVVALHDQGDSSDLQQYTPPDLTEPHEGGYGVHIIQSLMDEVHYDITGQGTILTLVKYR